VLYPPSFRERYGEELQALVEDSLPSWRLELDLARGAARAWLFPQFRGSPQQRRQARMLATILTVFWAWSLVLLAVASLNHSIADPRIPGVGQPVAHVAYEVSQIAIQAATAMIALGGVIYWFAIVRRAGRAHLRAVLLPAVVPVLVVLGWVGATLILGWWVLHFANGYHLPRLALTGVLFLVGTWIVVSAGCVPVCWIAITRAMRRADLSARLLRPGIVGAALVAMILVVVVVSMGVAVAALAIQGRIPANPGDLLFGYCVVPFAAAAMGVGLVSGGRGMGALRATRAGSSG
jgi:hypothetical protein